MDQRQTYIDSTPCVCWKSTNQINQYPLLIPGTLVVLTLHYRYASLRRRGLNVNVFSGGTVYRNQILTSYVDPHTERIPNFNLLFEYFNGSKLLHNTLWFASTVWFAIQYRMVYLYKGFDCIPANTKHLYNMCTTSAQRLRRWSNIVQMLCKCFLFAEIQREFYVSLIMAVHSSACYVCKCKMIWIIKCRIIHFLFLTWLSIIRNREFRLHI